MHELPGVEETETPGVYKLPELTVEETADHTEEDINQDISLPPIPPPMDAKDETIIQPKFKQVVIKIFLGGVEEPDKDATNDNENFNNAIPDNGEMENYDDKLFHPINPLSSEKRA